MVIVVVVPHWPASGVKVYSVVAILFKAGAHVPFMLLFEVVGKADKESPAQIGSTCVKVGVSIGFTVMVMVVVVPHSPIFGVNVYSVVAILFKAGAHVPLMPLVEVVGKAVKVAPAQIGSTCVNVGVGGALHSTFKLLKGTVESAAGDCACTQFDVLSKTASVTEIARFVASYSVLKGAEAGKPLTTIALV